MIFKSVNVVTEKAKEQSLLKLMSVESVMPSNHLILCHSLLLLPSIFPSISGRSREFLKSNLLGGGRYREKLFLGGQNCPIRPLWAEGSGRFQLNWMRVLVRRVQAARSWLRPVCRPHDLKSNVLIDSIRIFSPLLYSALFPKEG